MFKLIKIICIAFFLLVVGICAISISLQPSPDVKEMQTVASIPKPEVESKNKLKPEPEVKPVVIEQKTKHWSEKTEHEKGQVRLTMEIEKRRLKRAEKILRKRLAYLKKNKNISWVSFCDDNVHVGFKNTKGWKNIISTAARHGSKAVDDMVCVFAVPFSNDPEVGLLPGGFYGFVGCDKGKPGKISTGTAKP